MENQKAYKNHKRNGQYKGYSSNGNLYVEYTFIDDKKNGPFALYYKSGKLKEKGTYKDDVVHGKVSFFEEDGTLSMEVEFKNGNPISAMWGDGRKWTKKELMTWWKKGL